MVAPASSRRGLILGLAALPLGTGVASAPKSAASPELLHLIQICEDRHRDVEAATALEERSGVSCPKEEWRRLCRASAASRGAVALYPASCLGDIALKLRAMRVTDYGRAEIREEVENACADWCYGETLAMAIIADLMGLEEAGLCA